MQAGTADAAEVHSHNEILNYQHYLNNIYNKNIGPSLNLIILNIMWHERKPTKGLYLQRVFIRI